LRTKDTILWSQTEDALHACILMPALPGPMQVVGLCICTGNQCLHAYMPAYQMPGSTCLHIIHAWLGCLHTNESLHLHACIFSMPGLDACIPMPASTIYMLEVRYARASQSACLHATCLHTHACTSRAHTGCRSMQLWMAEFQGPCRLQVYATVQETREESSCTGS
jgi:hypothetical protein